MNTNSKPRIEYEDRYDRRTVEQGRRDMDWFWKARDEFQKKVEANGSDMKQTAIDFWWGRLCHWLVELPLGERWENREATIQKWQSEDEVKDQRLENTRPQTEPNCQHCGKTGLRLSSKLLHNRDGNYDDLRDELVLFVFKCPHCQKATSCWEDGEQFKAKLHLCPNCQVSMTGKDVKRGLVITTTYNCPACGHKETVKLDLRPEKVKPDPDYERDKALFCFDDERGRKYLEYKVHWDELRRMFEKQKEKEANKELYDALENLEKLKVTDLIERVRPAVEKEGYIEVRFDEPETGRDFIVGFSCLDGQSSREDNASSSTLRKTMRKALEQTNWRLMSEGISYRLGYLHGRIKAYEHDDDLIRLLKTKR